MKKYTSPIGRKILKSVTPKVKTGIKKPAISIALRGKLRTKKSYKLK